MKITLWVIGKTKRGPYQELVSTFTNRIKNYCLFDYHEFDFNYKKVGSNPHQVKKYKAEKILSKLNSNTNLVLMDEKGKVLSSEKFSDFIENARIRNLSLTFLIGGAYGFDNILYQKASYKLSLSTMTFTHQMARVILLEQIYRTYTILNNEPYHNT